LIVTATNLSAGTSVNKRLSRNGIKRFVKVTYLSIANTFIDIIHKSGETILIFCEICRKLFTLILRIIDQKDHYLYDLEALLSKSTNK